MERINSRKDPMNESYFSEVWINPWSSFWRLPLSLMSLMQVPHVSTGKSLSEALIFESTNPQYDDRLFIELQVQYMKIPSSEHGRICCLQELFLSFRTISENLFLPMFWKNKSFWQRFMYLYIVQIIGGDFTIFCGLFWIYELY